MSITNETNAHISRNGDDDNESGDESNDENSMPCYKDHPTQLQHPLESQQALRPNPSKTILPPKGFRPRNFSPWSSTTTHILSPPQPAKLSRSPARGILLNLTKTPPRASYAEKVKGIFASNQSRQSRQESRCESRCETERSERIARSHECNDVICLPNGRRARIIETRKRIFLQYVDDEENGAVEMKKEGRSASRSSSAQDRSESDGVLANEPGLVQGVNKLGDRPSEMNDRNVEVDQGLSTSTGLEPYSTTPLRILGSTERSSTTEERRTALPDHTTTTITSAPATSIAHDHLVASEPEHRSRKKKRERRVKITPGSLPLSPPWKQPSRRHQIYSHDSGIDDQGQEQRLADCTFALEPANPTFDKDALLRQDSTRKYERQIAQLDGASSTTLENTQPPSVCRETDDSCSKALKVPIDSLGHVSSIRSLLSPPWKMSVPSTYSLALSRQPQHHAGSPKEAHESPPEKRNLEPLGGSPARDRTVPQQYYVASSIDEEGCSSSSDAWTDDSKFLPAYTMRRQKREARKRRGQQWIEQQNHSEYAMLSQSEAIVSPTRLQRPRSKTQQPNLWQNDFSPRPSRFTGIATRVVKPSRGLRGSADCFKNPLSQNIMLEPEQDSTSRRKGRDAKVLRMQWDYRPSDADDEDSGIDR